MIIVKKRRGKPVVFILIAVNVLLVCVSLFILFWPTRPSSKKATKAAESQTEESSGTRKNAAVTATAPGENEAFLRMRVEQVYAHNATRLYYPEGCKHRPEKAYKIARSLAIKQGFTLAANCTE